MNTRYTRFGQPARGHPGKETQLAWSNQARHPGSIAKKTHSVVVKFYRGHGVLHHRSTLEWLVYRHDRFQFSIGVTLWLISVQSGSPLSTIAVHQPWYNREGNPPLQPNTVHMIWDQP